MVAVLSQLADFYDYLFVYLQGNLHSKIFQLFLSTNLYVWVIIVSRILQRSTRNYTDTRTATRQCSLLIFIILMMPQNIYQISKVNTKSSTQTQLPSYVLKARKNSSVMTSKSEILFCMRIFMQVLGTSNSTTRMESYFEHNFFFLRKLINDIYYTERNRNYVLVTDD